MCDNKKNIYLKTINGFLKNRNYRIEFLNPCITTLREVYTFHRDGKVDDDILHKITSLYEYI